MRGRLFTGRLATMPSLLMGSPDTLSRRSLLASGLSMVTGAGRKARVTVYRFENSSYRIRLTLEYQDNYTSDGFGFREHLSDRRFCLSTAGQENRNCLEGFRGSLAIAHYQLKWRGSIVPDPRLRERVRDIDRSDSVPVRPPYERAIPLQEGAASDIQAFGYAKTPHSTDGNGRMSPEVWWLARQDLFLGDATKPFLIVHWRHRLEAIRVLDLIPGEGTRQLFE